MKKKKETKSSTVLHHAIRKIRSKISELTVRDNTVSSRIYRMVCMGGMDLVRVDQYGPALPEIASQPALDQENQGVTLWTSRILVQPN